ncbi:disease resistance protein RGA2-like [Zingiber officinale]|uniref:disease resistance protein RGA2-like n=1 Tax=Zingiber officinale TaxID=94328 RepID=UPI001C4CC6CA|nr:disease resistance protein RGA2-like [Zingiber officinale]XP_042447464.1 disease resistance protein RGA2-like [Zingiber officinale]
MEGAAALAVGGWLTQPVIKMLVDSVWTSSLRGKLYGLRDNDLQKLHRSLLNIDTIVDKAGMRWSREARLVEMMKQLQDAAYDAEDFLDDLTFHGMKQKIKEDASHKVLNQFSRAFSKTKTKLFSNSVKRLNKIQKKLDDIYADMEKMCQSLQVDASDGQYQSDLASATRETSSFLISKVFGREEEQKRIIGLLRRSTDLSASASDNGNSFSVIPLVGIGGVGKTTLAQLVYKDEEIQNHFAVKIWICVSENFNVQRLTKEMIESVTETEHDSQMKLDVLQNILKREIASKMILLVLDDVWNEDKEEWRKLCAPFMYAAAGSKVIVTTRSKSIADKIGTVEAIVLGDLDGISFWELFKQCAFGPSKPEEHPELVEIGRSIASKLKGLPLAAKTVGNLLGSNMNPHYWRSIMKSEVWELQQNKNDIIPVLQLSYHYLSAPLKRCFAFCSLFQKNHEFSEIELTRMWMAEGFVVAQGNQRMEDVASKYFHELVNMSLFQPETTFWRHYYVMHDLIHDLTHSVSVDETSRMDNGKSNKISTTLRHLAVETEFVETKELRYRFKKLHTVFCQHLKSPPLDFIEKLRSIRVLVLSHCSLRMLPTRVGELVHLRYLDISYNGIENLPESLCELYNLQTLIAKGNFPNSLPEEITQLINLRHLDVENTEVENIKMIGRLTSLQELSEFLVRKEVGFKITELSGLKQLHGKLQITNLENVGSKEEAEKAQMKNKEYLDALELEWGFDPKLENKLVAMEEVLEGLQPHESLKQLKIRRYCGARSPSWIKKEELSNLERLELSNCESWRDIFCTALLPHLKVFHIESSMWFSKSCFEVCGSRESKLFPMLEELQLRNMIASEELPNLGRFPCLKVVRMTEIESLKHIDFAASSAIENSLFSMLECLELIYMPALEEFSTLGYFPRLRVLRMIGMRLLKHIVFAASGAIENSLFPMLEELELRDMPALEEFSCVGHFPRLRVLHMIGMRLLKHIDFVASGAIENSLFPMLKEFHLKDMHALEGFSNLGHFPRLRVLRMIEMRLLKHIDFAASGAIENSLFPMLEELELRGMYALEEISNLGHFPRLKVLRMMRMRLLKHIGLASVATENDQFPMLEELELRHLPVLEELPDLGSLPCLKSLDIIRMRMLKHTDFAFYDVTEKVLLPRVEKLVLHDLEALKELPSNLGRLPCLKVLSIENISAVKQIGHGFFSTEAISQCFLSLRSLSILNMPSCEGWCWIDGSELFPSLQVLTIHGCPKLERLPPLPPSLTDLTLTEVGLTELPSLRETGTNGSGCNQTTSSLSNLKISECNNLTSLEEGLLSQNLSNIEVIYVEGCYELMRMPLKRFENSTSLKELQIKACPNLSLTQEEEAVLLSRGGSRNYMEERFFRITVGGPVLGGYRRFDRLWLDNCYRWT